MGLTLPVPGLCPRGHEQHVQCVATALSAFTSSITVSPTPPHHSYTNPQLTQHTLYTWIQDKGSDTLCVRIRGYSWWSDTL